MAEPLPDLAPSNFKHLIDLIGQEHDRLVGENSQLRQELAKYGAPGPAESTTVTAAAAAKSKATVSFATIWEGWSFNENASLEAVLSDHARLSDRSSLRAGDVLREDRGILQFLAINPNTPGYFLWSMIGALFMLADLVMIPMLAFDIQDTIALVALGLASTVYWSIDLAVSFVVGYDSAGVLEMRVAKLVRHYATTWLAPDCIIISCDWLLTLFSGSSSRFVRLGRTTRNILRIVRLYRVLRVARGQGYFAAHVTTISPVLRFGFAVIRLILIMMCLMHYLAGVWYAIGSKGDADDITWVRAMDLQDASIELQYTVSLQSVLAQVAGLPTSITPTNLPEFLFSSFIGLFGVLIFSWFVSSLTDAMATFRQFNANRVEQMEEARRYFSENKVSITTAASILDYSRSQAARNPIKEEQVALLSHLPKKLRTALRWDVYSPTLLCHPLFSTLRSARRHFMLDLCASVMERTFITAGQEVFVEGTGSRCTWFPASGKLEYTTSMDGVPALPLYAGHWACEASLWMDWTHVGSLMAETACDMIHFTADAFRGLAQKHAQCFAELCEYARAFTEHAQTTLDGSRIVLDVWHDKPTIRAITDYAFFGDYSQTNQIALRAQLQRCTSTWPLDPQEFTFNDLDGMELVRDPMMVIKMRDFLELSTMEPFSVLQASGKLQELPEGGVCHMVSTQSISTRDPAARKQQLECLQRFFRTILLPGGTQQVFSSDTWTTFSKGSARNTQAVAQAAARTSLWIREDEFDKAYTKDVENGYIWMPALCIPQVESSMSSTDCIEVLAKQSRAIRSLPHYSYQSTYFYICAPRSFAANGAELDFSTWRESGWCRAQEWANFLRPKAMMPIVITELPQVQVLEFFDFFLFRANLPHCSTFHGSYQCCERGHVAVLDDGSEVELPCDKDRLADIVAGMYEQKLASLRETGNDFMYRIYSCVAPSILAGSARDLGPGACSSAETVAEFLDRFLLPPDPSEGDVSGATAMEWAAFAGHTDMVSKLLGLGYTADTADKGGLTPLLGAAMCCNSERMLELLIDTGGLSVEAVNRSTVGMGISPLDRAAKGGNLAAVQLLLDRRALVNCRRKTGHTPLLSAAETGSADVCELLLEWSADINARAEDGQGALHVACCGFSVFGRSQQAREDTARVLLRGKADPLVRDALGRTPMQLADSSGMSNMAEILLGGVTERHSHVSAEPLPLQPYQTLARRPSG